MAALRSTMPRSFLLAALLVIAQLAALSNAETFTLAVPDNNLELNCALTLGGYGYNLCPLIEKSALVPVEETDPNEDNESYHKGLGPSFASRFFQLNLGLGVRERRGPASPEVLACDEYTWVCLTSVVAKEARKSLKYKDIISMSRAIARRGNQQEITALLEIRENGGERTSSPLRLLMGDSSIRNGIAQSAEIVLHCSETDHLAYISERHGLHSFSWETPHACPTTYPRDISSGIFAAEEPNNDQEQPPSEDEEKEEDNLIPPQGMSKIRRFMVIALAILLVPSICGFILFSSSRARSVTTEKVHTALLPFLSRVALKLRPLGNTINSLTSQSISRLKSPFRQGEGQLVRWAQEDMTLADSDDIMVNGSLDEDRWDADGLEEYIPLTINPRHGRSRRVRSYGATPDVETFAERQQGLLSTKIGKYFKR